MIRIWTITAALAVAMGALSTGPVFAASQCRDSAGKFVKCATQKPAKCRDSKTGKFIKCGAPGTSGSAK